MSESSANNHGDPYGQPLPAQLTVVRKTAGMVGVIGFGLLIIFGLFNHTWGFRSLLFAWHFWLYISLGCLGFVMISHLTGGGWGAMMRRVGEAGFLNLPYLALVFLVMALGYKYLFPWAHPADFPEEAVQKVFSARGSAYTPTWFTIRTLIYFCIWMALAFSLRKGSLKLDLGEDLVLRRKLRKVSAGGMVLFFITTTGYAFDYILSRETMWYSSIIGFITAVSMGLSGMAFISLVMCYFADKKPFKGMLNAQHLNDYGNIMLALVILWMYTSFAQYLIQWNGNIPEDISYYTHRGLGWPRNGWSAVALLVLIGHFFIPFFLLLQKPLKRNPTTFAKVAGWILFMRFVECLWIIAPSGGHRDIDAAKLLPLGSTWWTGDSGQIFWTDFIAFAAVGGIWIANFLRILGSKPLIARNIADLPEMVSAHETAHGTAHGTAHA
jgi:hypothetical protein